MAANLLKKQMFFIQNKISKENKSTILTVPHTAEKTQIHLNLDEENEDKHISAK